MLSMLGQRTLLTRLWRTPTYRTFLLLMVLMSLATSAGIPLIALYLVRDLSLALSLAGLFFTGQALPGLALGLLLGRRSDAWATRLPFIRRATAWVGAGWLVLALSPFPGCRYARAPSSSAWAAC